VAQCLSVISLGTGNKIAMIGVASLNSHIKYGEKRSAMRKPVPGQWSKTEVAKLKALAGKKPVRVIVNELRRSPGAVTAKAFSLRISLNVRHLRTQRVGPDV
jgi:hypothetical protein